MAGNRYRKLFEKFDADSDGTLDNTEMRELLKTFRKNEAGLPKLLRLTDLQVNKDISIPALPPAAACAAPAVCCAPASLCAWIPFVIPCCDPLSMPQFAKVAQDLKNDMGLVDLDAFVTAQTAGVDPVTAGLTSRWWKALPHDATAAQDKQYIMTTLLCIPQVSPCCSTSSNRRYWSHGRYPSGFKEILAAGSSSALATVPMPREQLDVLIERLQISESEETGTAGAGMAAWFASLDPAVIMLKRLMPNTQAAGKEQQQQVRNTATERGEQLRLLQRYFSWIELDDRLLYLNGNDRDNLPDAEVMEAAALRGLRQEEKSRPSPRRGQLTLDAALHRRALGAWVGLTVACGPQGSLPLLCIP